MVTQVIIVSQLTLGFLDTQVTLVFLGTQVTLVTQVIQIAQVPLVTLIILVTLATLVTLAILVVSLQVAMPRNNNKKAQEITCTVCYGSKAITKRPKKLLQFIKNTC